MKFTGLIMRLALASLFSAWPLLGAAQDAAQQAGPADGSSIEQRVGDLGFRIVSLRVAPGRQNDRTSMATVSFEVRNYGQMPLALNYDFGSVNLTDDHGYTAPEYQSQSHLLTGMPIANEHNADASFIVDPGARVGAQFHLARFMPPGQTLGTVYDFAAQFSSYQDLGEGHLKKLRSYPVSITGVRRAPALQGAMDDAGDQVKHAFGSLFQH